MADTLDIKHEFERWMSQRGESAVYIGDGFYNTGSACDQAEAFRAGVEIGRAAALASRPAEVDDEGLPGWKLVPVELTEDMLIAFAEVWYSKKRCIDDCEMADCYAAMLEAAPSHTTNKEKD